MLTKKLIVGHLTFSEAEKKIKECNATQADIFFKCRGETVWMIMRHNIMELAQVC